MLQDRPTSQSQNNSYSLTNDLSRKRLFPEISSFSKTSDFSGIPSKHPKSFSVVSEMHFEEGAFRKAYMAKCSTYPFKNKQ